MSHKTIVSLTQMIYILARMLVWSCLSYKQPHRLALISLLTDATVLPHLPNVIVLIHKFDFGYIIALYAS